MKKIFIALLQWIRVITNLVASNPNMSSREWNELRDISETLDKEIQEYIDNEIVRYE